MSVNFVDNSAEILEAMEFAKKRGLKAIGMAAEGYAKEQLYEGHGLDTGRLRNSISHATDEDSAYIGTNVEYAIYVELGARGRSGYHYLQKASTEHTEEYKAIMEASMRNA